MALTDAAIRAAKAGEKPIKLGDEKGLFLLLQPGGGKLWRLKYRVAGREKKIGLGIYPEVGLKEARRRRDEARSRLAAGIDPSEARKAAALSSAENARNTFAVVAEEYLEKSAGEGLAAVTIAKSRWLLSLMLKDLGSRPVADITSAQVLDTLRQIEARGHRETAKRMQSLSGRVFCYAIQTNRATNDPTKVLRGALKTP